MAPESEFIERLSKVERELYAHTEVCAERYAGIMRSSGALEKRISSMNAILLSVAGGVVLQLLALLGYLISTRAG